ncbi:MAG TPA: prealbumin-like fold domain-containing protein, partial [Gemmatimonadaceae bacterium]|nr:prealbumin-like fold domain-containing protein [Gemmatimonadaceae bacterium]
GATPPRLLTGATFQVRRTNDRYGAAVTTPSFSVTDNAAPDVDAVGGQFKVVGLPLGTYCIEETAAPDGYLLDPNVQCGIVLTIAAPNGSAKPFVDGLIGRMTGGTGKVEITDDVYLTSGFTIHCDIVLSNNLEINWPGNKWHLDKPIKTALCTDEPNVEPGQPNAPFDTFFGTAVGELNGVSGSRIEFTFQDGGEPGKRADLAAIKIWSADGTSVVLDLSLRAIKGNIQAHEDQPHK